jgi:hypothetical protein
MLDSEKRKKTASRKREKQLVPARAEARTYARVYACVRACARSGAWVAEPLSCARDFFSSRQETPKRGILPRMTDHAVAPYASPSPRSGRADNQARLRVALEVVSVELGVDLWDVAIVHRSGAQSRRAACTIAADGTLSVFAQAKSAQALVVELESWLRGFRAARRAGAPLQPLPAGAGPEAEPTALTRHRAPLAPVQGRPGPATGPGPAEMSETAAGAQDPDLQAEEREDLVGL